jgi:hypothetical protein
MRSLISVSFVQLLCELQAKYRVWMRHIRKFSYHGMSICDSHFGVINQHIGRAYHAWWAPLRREAAVFASGKMVTNPAPMQHAPDVPSNAAQLTQFVNANLQHTRMHCFTTINRDQKLKPTLRQLDSKIRSQHDFQFPEPGLVRAKRLSTDADDTAISEWFKKRVAKRKLPALY